MLKALSTSSEPTTSNPYTSNNNINNNDNDNDQDSVCGHLSSQNLEGFTRLPATLGYRTTPPKIL